MNDTNLHPWIEPEFEARLTALVLGEASDFERDELERLVADRPELGLYRKRLEVMHRMLREVATGENAEEQGEWKLGVERRTAVLARLRGEGTAEETVVVMSRSKRRLPWGVMGRIAACFAVIGLVLSLILRSLTTVLGDAERPKNNAMAFTQSDGREILSRSDGYSTVGHGDVGASGRYGVPLDGSDLGKYPPAQTEWRHYPLAKEKKSDVDREVQELALADRTLRLPAPTSATPAPAAEPPGVSRSGQISVGDGTVALGSASGTTMAAEGAGVASEGDRTLEEIRDEDRLVALSLPSAETLEREKAQVKVQAEAGELLVEEKRMEAFDDLSSGAAVAAAPADAQIARRRGLVEGKIAATSVPEKGGTPPLPQIELKNNIRTKDQVIRRELATGPGLQQDHDVAKGTGVEDKTPILKDIPVLGSLFSGQAGAGKAPVASAAKPLMVTAAPVFDPAPAGEPMLKEQLQKQHGGTGALAGGVVEFDGFTDIEGKKKAESNSHAARGNMSDYIFDGNRFQADGKNVAVPTPGTVNLGNAVSQVENPEEAQKTGDANVALPGLQSDKKTFRFTVRAGSERKDAEVEIDEPWSFGRAGEVDQSVLDIMALTPQVGKDVSQDRDRMEMLYNVVPRIVGGGSESGTRVIDSSVSVPDDDAMFPSMDDVIMRSDRSTPAALAETSPSAEPFSTFSLHVSDVSFQLAKSSLASGKWPEAEKIRIEEFVNAFDYGDPVPSMGERVACRIDQGAHPFLQQRNLVRIALRTAEAGRSSGTPLRLTLLLDSSGSMERPDRRATLTRAVATLAGLLGENDRITLVSFARQPRLVADAVAGNEAMQLAETVAALPSEGGTNLEAALQLAFEKAREHQEPNAQNRIVLLTDGAANLGDAKAESLGARVEMMREAGIAFDAAGFGAEGLNDEILEALTRKGDGRYYLLDRPEDAGEAFAEQIAGALRPAAKNVKVQVEFNPDRVKSYKLLGFEKHRLATEDFRNDAVDAAELAAAEAGVAVYQVEPDPAGEGDLGSVSVRFRDLESGAMTERRWALPHVIAPAADQGGDAILLATVASQFAAKLAGGPLGDVVDLGELARLAAALPESERVKELRTMIEQARNLEGVSVSF